MIQTTRRAFVAGLLLASVVAAQAQTPSTRPLTFPPVEAVTGFVPLPIGLLLMLFGVVLAYGLASELLKHRLWGQGRRPGLGDPAAQRRLPAAPTAR